VKHPVSRTDHLLGAALAVAYVALLLYTAPALGLARDEGIYVWAAESYGRWYQALLDDPGVALTRAAIDPLWRVNHEHPALVKTLFAWSHLLDARFHLFTRESLAFRFPGMLSAGLLLWLVHVFGTRLYGRRAGLFAACAYALLPRPFYHAHLDAFDVPITLAVTAVSYAYLRSLTNTRWAWLTGLAFGAALATKHNSWVLPGIFAIHFVLVLLLQRRRGHHVVSRWPRWLIAMALLGPLIFVGSWPWLWHDTGPRLRSYAAFHLHHEYYNIAYFGVNYFWPPFPISFPWVMTLFTVPLTTLACAALGLWRAGRELLERIRVRAQLLDAEFSPHDATQPELLLLGCLLAPLVIISLPSTPIFGATKHWFTAYPFLVIFAGAGFSRALERAEAALVATHARLRAGLLALGSLLVLAPAAVETAHSHPFALSHYGMAAGFVAGAAEKGMNRQFWGYTTGSLVGFLNQALPRGGRVYPCDTLDGSFRMLGRDGLLAPNILPTPNIADADFALVHHEHHFAEVDQQIWTTWGSTRPVHVLTYDGVPIISVYENPRHAARRGR
jgi:4-amino-4-deoxy-L-arabinose transferase-like glycosyltransferase